MSIQPQNAPHSVEGKSLGTLHRRAEGLGLLFGKGEAENNGSRRGLDCKVRIGALTECEEHTGLNRDERQQQRKRKEKASKHTLEMQGCLGVAWGREWGRPVVVRRSAGRSLLLSSQIKKKKK